MEWLKYIQEIFGSCCTDNCCTHNKMFVLWGDGSNGKTTFMELMQKVLGALIIKKVPSDVISDAGFNQKIPITTKIILIEEDDCNFQPDVAVIKSLLATDSSIRICLITNGYLKFPNNEFLNDQIIVIPFCAKFVYNAQGNNEFTKKSFILDELSSDGTILTALVNWMLEGAKLSGGAPGCVEVAIDEYLSECANRVRWANIY